MQIDEKVKNRILLWAVIISRIVFGGVFLFSGFVKAIDPVGSAYKFDDYFAAFGLSALNIFSLPLAFSVAAFEFYLGANTLLGANKKRTPLLDLLFMLFMTPLTLYLAIANPVSDCGCFGDALILTNWETFFKNLILLPMSAVVWAYYRHDRVFNFNLREIILTVFFFLFTMGIGLYCYRHLPLIDFLPYKVGVNILEEMEDATDEVQGEVETVLVYRNKQSGEVREFAIEDPEWQDESKWEWVDTKVSEEPLPMHSLIEEFALRDGADDVTRQVLSTPGRLYLVCVTTFDRVGRKCSERLRLLIGRAEEEQAQVVCITPQALQPGQTCSFGGGIEVPCYNIDASTMKTMLRSMTGVVVLEDGVIVDKRNCRDIE